MKLLLQRIARKPSYTIGRLYLDGVYVCDTLEDTDRYLSADMPLIEVQRHKVKHQTAIPTGTYRIDLQTHSRAFGSQPFYRDVCGGKLPRLMDVKAFQGVLIHCGNTPSDTSGCILVGENKVVGKVVNSQQAFRRLYALIRQAGDLTLEIQRIYT